MRLDYKAPSDLGMLSPADQEEVIYEIASQAYQPMQLIQIGKVKKILL